MDEVKGMSMHKLSTNTLRLYASQKASEHFARTCIQENAASWNNLALYLSTEPQILKKETEEGMRKISF